MNYVLAATVFLIAGYLIGGIPFGVLVGKSRGVDIRTLGSRNIGATNVGRLLGRKWGTAVFLLDALKGFGPVFAATLVLQPLKARDPAVDDVMFDLTRMGVGMTCILGHAFSPFLGFAGGKGVATGLGVALGVFPDLTYPGLIAFAVWVIVVLATRYVSLASIVACLAFAAAFALLALGRPEPLSQQWPLAVFVFTVVALIMIRHRENIGRLLRGTEAKLGTKAQTDQHGA